MCCPSNSDNRNASLGRRTHLRRTQYTYPTQPGMVPETFNEHLRAQAPIPDRHHPFEHMRTLATYRVLPSHHYPRHRRPSVQRRPDTSKPLPQTSTEPPTDNAHP